MTGWKLTVFHQAIDDEEITTEIPSGKVDCSTMEYDFFKSAVRHAQIASQISRRLGSTRALQRDNLIDTVRDLSAQVEEWYHLMPFHLKIDMKRGFTQPPVGSQAEKIMYLQYGYLGSLMAIHAIFAYPWIGNFDAVKDKPAFSSQRVSSSDAVADAARNVILGSRLIRMDAACPHW